jgi:hypothetical protein
VGEGRGSLRAADPYLAVTLDAKRRIAQVARALDQPHPGPAAWGLLELLEDVWRRKDPAVSALVLAACFGPDPRWPEALVAFGFLEVRDGGWTLHPTEADRLLLTHAKRVAAGKARAGGAKRDRHGRLQHITSTSPAPVQQHTSTPPAADQLLQPAASSQQQKIEALSAAADPPAFSPEDMRTAYNAGAARQGWVKWESMPDTRKRAAVARLREHPERAWWESVVKAAEGRPFLRGENDRGWKMDADFFVRPGMAERILEGKYDGRQTPAAPARKTVLL